MPSTNPYTDRALYRRLVALARPYWAHVVGILLLSLAATPLALLAPLPLKIAVDTVIGEKPLPDFLAPLVPISSDGALLIFAAVLLVGIVFVQELKSLAEALLGTYTGERLMLAFRAQLFRHGQLLSLAYHDAKGTADAAYRIQYDATSIQTILVYGITPFVTAFFTLIGMIVVIARIDWQLSLVAFTIAPILLALSVASRRRLRSGWREAKQLESASLTVIQEVFTGLRVVKAFGQEEREHDRFLSRSSAGMRVRIRLALYEGAFALVLGLVAAIGTAAVLYVGVLHVQSGVLTLGSLVLVLAYLSQFYAPLRSITKSIANLQASLASAERAFALLDEAPDVPERPHARPLRRAAGAVLFEEVSFAYGTDRPILERVSFEVEPGTRVGISGRTGAGKTTLVSLLTRFQDPTGGRILLDGHDLRDYQVADLRNQFAIVLQEPVLFSTTLSENIAYGRPEADHQEIVAAARAADIHDFIVSLPDGYETQVGERGMSLSGGERQRVSLARAFLKDAPILILDEPTSSVDLATEATIMSAMARLMEGRTTFLIAHRLSTLDSCDLRLVVEESSVRAEAGQPRGAWSDGFAAR